MEDTIGDEMATLVVFCSSSISFHPASSRSFISLFHFSLLIAFLFFVQETDINIKQYILHTFINTHSCINVYKSNTYIPNILYNI